MAQQIFLKLILLTIVLQFKGNSKFLLNDTKEKAFLDSAWRKSLSDYIRQWKDIQFAGTTFRKEIIDSGDNFLGVKHENGISKIQLVSKEEALPFVR